ncbi:MAG: type II toxin-antitoxin system HicA family toxin [Clostridiaceae bacterium]|jgi:predicted RNA binding protein YcfA (HicA-like mRNA interferase family)|nr:type II toxin-antitoxin system HicA family toxin [Clostridiaceae bacterium]HQD32052.1 type II toxin-antitoxin system HicA family toxin [Clostridiales bacterium]
MSKLTIISSKDMAKILESLGFKEIRQKGSHTSYKHADGRTTVVPFHGEDLGRGLIRKILKDIEITPDEYEELRKRI